MFDASGYRLSAIGYRTAGSVARPLLQLQPQLQRLRFPVRKREAGCDRAEAFEERRGLPLEALDTWQRDGEIVLGRQAEHADHSVLPRARNGDVARRKS